MNHKGLNINKDHQGKIIKFNGGYKPVCCKLLKGQTRFYIYEANDDLFEHYKAMGTVRSDDTEGLRADKFLDLKSPLGIGKRFLLKKIDDL